MTENKRFENRLNKSNIKFNTLNPVWDNEKEDALNIFEMIDLLNELNDECEFLEIENESLEDGATKYAELYHKSLKENEQLKKDLKRCREWLNSDKYDYQTTLAFIKSKGYSMKDVLEYKGDVE